MPTLQPKATRCYLILQPMLCTRPGLSMIKTRDRERRQAPTGQGVTMGCRLQTKGRDGRDSQMSMTPLSDPAVLTSTYCQMIGPGTRGPGHKATGYRSFEGLPGTLDSARSRQVFTDTCHKTPQRLVKPGPRPYPYQLIATSLVPRRGSPPVYVSFSRTAYLPLNILSQGSTSSIGGHSS